LLEENWPNIPKDTLIPIRKCSPVESVWKFNGTEKEGWYPKIKK
jgi:hypothetical protein